VAAVFFAGEVFTAKAQRRKGRKGIANEFEISFLATFALFAPLR
jgi:hypothetical protein